MEGRVIDIHTSDLINFKRCRRRWNWTSPIRENLVPLEGNRGPLWLGSGFHFALEDYHGFNVFEHPVEAFLAYVEAHRANQLPEDAEELIELGCSMLSYYADVWLNKPGREKFQTFQLIDIANGVDWAVEMKWAIPILVRNGEQVNYVGTFDRVVRDSEGRIWVIDYKTAARLESANLETDSQVSAYTWAARQLFGQDVEGVIWQQHLKKQANGPAILKNGEFSKNRAAGVPWSLYHSALIEKFGHIPEEYREHLSSLLDEETEYGDAFIRQIRIRRSEESTANFEIGMLEAVEDMLDDEVKLYTNPTRDCSWDCSVRTACITMDDGYDWEDILGTNYVTRPEEVNWRDRIKMPEIVEKNQEQKQLSLL